MITIDNAKCSGCGICLKYGGGYCLNKIDDRIEIDYSVCGECQKCVSLCPNMSFSNNGKPAERISSPLALKADDLYELFRRRRSIKHFKAQKVPEELLREIVSAAKYAPTNNKNIEVIVINDEKLINEIDAAALKFVGRIYRIMYGSKLIFRFLSLFSDTLPLLKKKMELDLVKRKHIVKDNTAALIFVIGNPRVPVTEVSAQYYLANMLIYAETTPIGTCLMDSIKTAANSSGQVRKSLGIPGNFKVLGVLAVGYPAENILNVPEGYEVKISWNKRNI